MLRTLNGGPAGGEEVEMDGAVHDYDCGSRLARYEVRQYEIDGVVSEIAVFVGYVAKP